MPSQDFNKEESTLGKTDGTFNDYPALLVYDLDACLWDQEMFQMPEIPTQTVLGDLNGRGDGVVSVMSGPHRISLNKGALQSLQEHFDGTLYPNMKIAFASSADTPFAVKIARQTLKLLEVVPGTTVWDVSMRDWDGKDINQIGRTYPLSSNKSETHFPILKDITKIRYDNMLFFDDCNWGDHCSMVEMHCREKDSNKGPITMKTPRGLSVREWNEGLQKYKTEKIKKIR